MRYVCHDSWIKPELITIMRLSRVAVAFTDRLSLSHVRDSVYTGSEHGPPTVLNLLKLIERHSITLLLRDRNSRYKGNEVPKQAVISI